MIVLSKRTRPLWERTCSGLPDAARLSDTPALPGVAILGCGGNEDIMVAEGTARVEVHPDYKVLRAGANHLHSGVCPLQTTPPSQT